MPLALEIISPERLLLARDVDMVVIPGTEGDLGILPSHAKVVTSLRGGLVDIYEGGKVTDRFFVTGGFAEVTEARCSVLADEIIRQAAIDTVAAQVKLAEAKAAFEAVDTQDTDAYREASDKLISAQAMVDSAVAAPAPAQADTI